MDNTNQFWDDEKVSELLRNVTSYVSPEHWNKVIEDFKKSKEVKKEYEILSFTHKNTPNGSKLKLHLNGLYYWKYDGGNANPFNLDEIISSNNFNIYSIKRLSDSEVFTLGDKVFIDKKDEPTNWIGEIRDFWIDGNGKMHICYNGHHYKIKYFKKAEVKKEPLFTTCDGKEIFEGDTYWTMDKNAFEYWYSGAASSVFNSGKGNGMLFFSTEDAAKNYILFNKPLLTIKDILALWAIDNEERKPLIELAKKKINGK